MYIPFYYDDKDEYLFKIPQKWVYTAAACLPLFAFITCMSITMVKDNKQATWTHCMVDNVLPSLSAVIGNYEPQRTIWQSCIYVHAPARFLIAFLRIELLENIINKNMMVLAYISVAFNLIENIALLGLTFWPSVNSFSKHKICFGIFVIASLIHMLLTFWLLSKHRRKPMATINDFKSLKFKKRCFAINLISIVMATYLYARHNMYCEPYIYSYFAMMEYTFVLTNISFHLTTIYDFKHKDLLFTSKGIVLR